MPFKNISQLPESIKKLPHKAQLIFLNVFNRSFAKNGEDLAMKIAWTAVKGKFKRIDNQWVAKGLGLELYEFTLETNDDSFVQCGEDGEFFVEAILTDNQFDTEGRRFTSSALKSYADQINEFGIPGNITHEDWDEFKLKYSHLSPEEFVKKARSERKGILKTVKAVYEKGKLWIKALIDKRYVNHVRRFKTLSIEALIPKKFRTNNSYTGGHVLGFALDNRAKNTRARISRIS